MVNQLTENIEKAVGQFHRNNLIQLVHSEKMAAIEQLAAGVAHEINNPLGYVMSNLEALKDYVRTIKQVLTEYEKLEAWIEFTDDDGQKTIRRRLQEIREGEDFAYIMEDIDQLIAESIDGAERIRDIVRGLKCFARVDEAQLKEADINEGIEAALKICNELKCKCQVHKRLSRKLFQVL